MKQRKIMVLALIVAFLFNIHITSYTFAMETTKAPSTSNIKITNNYVGIDDIIEVTGLVQGDIVNVYSASSGGELIGSATVAEGQTSVTITKPQLGISWGYIYVSAKSINKYESSRVQKQYDSEPKTAAPYQGYITVTNNYAGIDDTIQVTGLVQGDIVNVYTASSGGELIGSATVAAGQTSVTITKPQLGIESGTIYVSVKSINMYESSRVSRQYSSEPKTPAPYYGYITVTNNYAGIDDTIQVTGLVQGDIVNIYTAASGGELIGSATVAAGQTSVTITKPQLGIESGTIYVSVKSINMYESSRVSRQYSSEPKTPAPYYGYITVTNNYAGIDDTIQITGLVQGDIVNVYTAASGGELIGGATVAAGQTSVTITKPQLGIESGTIYVSVKSINMYESSRVSRQYSSEPKTAAPYYGNITVTNNYAGIDDTIQITGLVQGDIVNIYTAASGGELIGSATVAAGQTSVTLTKPQLGIESGTIYVSVKSINMYESSRVSRQYSSEPKTAAPYQGYITVTNNYAGIDDTIQITGLVQGDIVNVYTASSGGELIGSATVAAGQTSVTLTKPQLGVESGYIYVSVKSINMYESSRVSRQYSSEPKTAAPYQGYITVTNNYAGIDDTIQVTGLVQGDIVNVYTASSGGELIGSATVAAGQTSVTITKPQLGVESGYIYVSVKSINMYESSRVSRQYSSEPKTGPEVDAAKAVVIAEASKLQSDIDSARVLVNSLTNNTTKNLLTRRLDDLQAIADATKAVIDAEAFKTQEYVNIAKELVNNLPNSVDKTNLNKRLSDVQEIINITKAIPQNLRYAFINHTTVNITWDIPSYTVAGYKIYRDGVEAGTSATEEFTDKDLTVGTTYTYTIKAYDAAGNTSAESSPLSVTTGEAPSAPLNLTYQLYNRNVELKWDAPTSNAYIVGYKIFQNQIEIGTTNNTAYNITNLESDTVYYFTVKAYNAAGVLSEASNEISVSIGIGNDTEPPTVPINTTASAITVTSVNLSWDPSSDNVGVVGYKIFRDSIEVGTTAETSYTDINLTQGSSYVYNIKAYDAAGNISEASTGITVTTIPAADNESPSSPTNLVAVSNTKDSVSLSWDASFDNVGVKGYRIYRNDFPITDVYSTNFTDTGLESGNSYIYKVIAFDDAGNISEFSNEITFISDESEARFPGNFSASVSGEFIYLSWDAVEGAIGYDISVNGEIRRINATGYQHLDVQINQEYSYKIRTVYEFGFSDWSSEIKKIYQHSEDQIMPPHILANPKTNKIELSWNSVENATGYELYIDGEIINIGNVLVYTHTNLLSNTKHIYKARCIYGDNQSEWSEVLELNTKTLEKPSNIISKAYVSSIELKWDMVSEAESYEIEINNKTKVVTKEPIFKHTNLFSNKSYAYKIRAVNSGGVSEWSETITSFTGELTAPINLEFSVTNKQIIISWNPVAEAVYYDVWIDGNIMNNGSSTQYTHLNLNPTTQYTYKVRALNSQGSGLWSQTYTVKTLLLDTPTNIKTTGTSDSVYLNWDRVDYATSYEIEIDEGTIITTETTNYINDDLTQESVHTYRIRAKNSEGISAWSDIVTQNTANLEDGIKGQWFSNNQYSFYRYLADSTQLNGKIYLIGGCQKIWNGTKYIETETATNEEYDPVSNTVVTRASMPTPRYGLAVVSLNGKIYAIGGMHEGKFVNTVEEYDPVTDTWKVKADMPTARMNLGAVVLNGKIYAVGGGGGNIYLGYVDCVEEYDPLTDIWTKKASMPTARYSLSLVTFNDKIYAIGGYNNNLSLNNIEVFDPKENIWSEKGVMPTARQGAGAVASNGKIFLMGGQQRVGVNTIKPVDMVEEYDPLTNLCRTLTPLPGASDYPICVEAIEDKLYVLVQYDSYCVIETFILSAPTNKPAIPNDVFTTISSNEITINWDLVNTATGYDIEIDGDKIVSVVANNYIHTQLTPGLEHTYRIRSKNISGNGEWSNSISTIIPDVKYSDDIMPKMTANNEPAGYTIIGIDYAYHVFDNDRTTPWYGSGPAPVGGHCFIIDFGAETPKVINKISLTSTPSGIKNWVLWASQDGNNYTMLTRGRHPNDGKYHDYIFNNSNAYRYYRLNILDSYFTPPSDCTVNEMELMTSQGMTIGIETPTNFKAASINENSVSLTWSEVSGATEYEIDMDGILFSTTGTSYSIENLLPGTKHNFRIRGRSATLYSDWSSVLSVSTSTEKIDDPYTISSIEDLLNIKNNLSGSYKLVNDIDLNNTEWESIGNSKTPFTGIFDGNGHTIKNLKIDKASNKYLGLFGVTNNATIKNINIENISINGTECIGALIGQAKGSIKIENCKIFGICNINGKSDLGGLVGYVSDGGTITGSSANVIITDSYLGSGHIGGLAGTLNNTILSKCSSTGDIISRDSYIGGLVGYADGSKISECYAIGNVKGSGYVGGLAGRFSSHDGIDNCYSLVNVVSDSLDLVGGFIGYANTDVKNCYSTGSVSTTKVTNVGGFVGGKGNTFEIINCYYDGVAAKYIPQNKLDTSKLTYSMLKPETFRGWDFDNIWCIDQNKSYPYLRNVDNSPQVFNEVYNGNMEGGKGTPENPYIIKTKEQLSNMKYEPSASYKLAGDIDLYGFEWEPVGNYTVPFTGDFDGTGYTIRNLKIDKTSTDYSGLFGVIDNANIKNVVIENADITGKNYVGALIGQANGTVEIKNCKILGNCSINGTSYLGGLVGDVDDGGIIIGCSAKINITSTNTGSVNIGGLAGSLDNTTVSKCYATGVIKGNSYVGGLIGITAEGDVSECYSTGDVFGQKCVGGLIGDADDREKSHKISNCYSLANVKSAIDGSYIGGFVGYSYLATIENCYSTGTIALTKSFTKGGFIGNGQNTSSSPLVNCFYDGVSAKYIPQYELDISKLTFSMTRRETFRGWDFDNIWQIDENKSYPYLKNIDNPTQVFIEGDIGDVEGGKGTPEDPYIIKSKEQLNNIRYELPASYKLAGDIDLGDIEWESIGNSTAPFAGNFDGNGYTIKNLKIDKSTVDYLGLFGVVKNVNIKNVEIENVDIKGQKYIGALVGQASGNIQIQNCKVLGNCKINGDSYMGGLAGYVFDGGNITNCSTEVDITSNKMSAGYIGGLIGKINLTTISKCFSEGDIVGECNYSGGLVGYEISGNISLSYATGNITSKGSDIGGLIGHADGGNVTESYASGNIKGSMYVGGFIGYLWNVNVLTLNVSNCYALGNVDGSSYTAGFAGYVRGGEVRNCYSVGSVTCSDSKTTGGFIKESVYSVNCYFNSNNSTSTTPIDQAKTTAQLMQQSTFTDWDFANIWGINEGMSYPFLKNIPNPSGINVAFKEITNDSISIEWNLINGVENYELEIDGETTVFLTQSNYVHLQLQPNTTHKYRARYHKQTVTSEWSPMVSATTLAVVIPIPQNVVVVYDKGQILVSWDKVTEAKEYEIEVDGKVINVGTALTYVHKNFADISQHTYRVRAKNSLAASKWSNIASAISWSEKDPAVCLVENNWLTSDTASDEVEVVIKANKMANMYTVLLELEYNPSELAITKDSVKGLLWDQANNTYFEYVVDEAAGKIKVLISGTADKESKSGLIDLISLKLKLNSVESAILKVKKAVIVDNSINYILTPEVKDLNIHIIKE